MLLYTLILIITLICYIQQPGYHQFLIDLMSKDLEGKVAVITASSTGIGKAIAQRFARDGCKVVVSSRSQSNVDEAVKEIQKEGGDAFGVVCDAGKKQDRLNLIAQAVKKYGGIDYLVCNAALSIGGGKFLEAKESDVQKLWHLNYMSVFLLIQEAVGELRKRKDAAIVVLSSFTAYDLSPPITHYAITKTALVALTKVVGKELLQDNIRVNAIAPGLIKTQFSSDLWKNDEKKGMKMMGVNRLGQVEDIAGIAKFLVSKDSSYMTGQCLAALGRPLSRL